MLQSVLSWLGGSAARLGELQDLSVLDHQLQAAERDMTGARRALACALAAQAVEQRRDTARLAALARLEHQASAALAGGRHDLALQAAQAIATQQNAALARDADRADPDARIGPDEVARMQQALRLAEQRLVGLRHGRTLARLAQSSASIGRGLGAAGGAPAIAAAEATLHRLRERQILEAEADRQQSDIDAATDPACATRRLAEAGFGGAPPITAEQVLLRLQAASIPVSSQPRRLA